MHNYIAWEIDKIYNLCSVHLSSEGKLVIDKSYLYCIPYHWLLVILQANFLAYFQVFYVLEASLVIYRAARVQKSCIVSKTSCRTGQESRELTWGYQERSFLRIHVHVNLLKSFNNSIYPSSTGTLFLDIIFFTLAPVESEVISSWSVFNIGNVILQNNNSLGPEIGQYSNRSSANNTHSDSGNSAAPSM